MICNIKVGKNGSHPHYGSHGFAWYCSRGFSVLGRDECRAHAKKHAPKQVVIHAVSPELKDRLEKTLGYTISSYPVLRAGDNSISEAVAQENLLLDFPLFDLAMNDEEFLRFYENRDIQKLSASDC